MEAGKFSPFLDELTRIETGLAANPSDLGLKERRRALWARATEGDLRDWSNLQLRLTQDPDLEMTAGFAEIFKEAKQLRAEALAGEPEVEPNVVGAGREEWDELKGDAGNEKFSRWARNMEKRWGTGKPKE